MPKPVIGSSAIMAPPLSDADPMPTAGAHDVLQIDPFAAVSGPGAPSMTKSEMADSAIGRAIKSVAEKQGGIGTVFIGDVAKQLGLSPNVLHEVIPSLVKQGLVNVNKSSMAEGRMSEDQLSGAMTLAGKRFHMMSLAK